MVQYWQPHQGAQKQGALGARAGDLKGGNVLLKSTSVHDDPRGFLCKIGDFGLSRVLDADNAHVTTNTYGARPLPSGRNT